MKLQQYYLGCLAHASYLIADEKTKYAEIVDPQRDIEAARDVSFRSIEGTTQYVLAQSVCFAATLLGSDAAGPRLGGKVALVNEIGVEVRRNEFVLKKGFAMNQLWKIVIMVLVGSATCTTGLATTLAEDSLETVKQDLAAGKAVLLDVREVDEWNYGHLQHARLLPLSQIEKGSGAKQLEAVAPAGKIIYLHCAAGARSQVAAKRLKASGRDLRPLTQGYDDLLRAGFPPAPR